MSTDFDVYKNELPYPMKPKKPIIKSTNPTVQDIENYTIALEQYEKDMPEYEKVKAAYYEEGTRLDTLFWNDIADELGIINNPKRYKLQAIAYDRGHSGGYEEVYGHMLALVELIRD